MTTVAEAAGLKLVAMFDRVEVEAGGTVTVDLSIQNTRATDVVFEEPCAIETLTVDLLVPVEPVGREWDGIAAAFKTYALENSTGSPMESSIRTPLPTAAKMLPCHAPNAEVATGQAMAIIEAGMTYETVLTWTAEIVSDVPATPGAAPFSIKVRYDLESAAGGMVSFETLQANGTITVVDGAGSETDAWEVRGHRPLMISGVVLHSLPAGYRFDLRHRQRITSPALHALPGGEAASS